MKLTRALGLVRSCDRELAAVRCTATCSRDETALGGGISPTSAAGGKVAEASDLPAEVLPICAEPKIMVSIRFSALRILYSVPVLCLISATMLARSMQLVQADGELCEAVV